MGRLRTQNRVKVRRKNKISSKNTTTTSHAITTVIRKSISFNSRIRLSVTMNCTTVSQMLRDYDEQDEQESDSTEY